LAIRESLLEDSRGQQVRNLAPAAVQKTGFTVFGRTVMSGTKLFSLLAVLATAIAGAGCNTVKGAGKDVQQAGKAVTA